MNYQFSTDVDTQTPFFLCCFCVVYFFASSRLTFFLIVAFSLGMYFFSMNYDGRVTTRLCVIKLFTIIHLHPHYPRFVIHSRSSLDRRLVYVRTAMHSFSLAFVIGKITPHSYMINFSIILFLNLWVIRYLFLLFAGWRKDNRIVSLLNFVSIIIIVSLCILLYARIFAIAGVKVGGTSLMKDGVINSEDVCPMSSMMVYTFLK